MLKSQIFVEFHIRYINEISLGIFGHELGVNIKATERTRFKLEECKPYLRPMSSMTDEERAERISILYELEGHIEEDVTYKYQDWLNTHHLDYRGLIPKGLAVEATEVIIHL